MEDVVHTKYSQTFPLCPSDTNKLAMSANFVSSCGTFIVAHSSSPGVTRAICVSFTCDPSALSLKLIMPYRNQIEKRECGGTMILHHHVSGEKKLFTSQFELINGCGPAPAPHK